VRYKSLDKVKLPFTVL